LTTLGLLDDQKDSVKLAAFQLSKTLKRLTLKLGNIYTNGNVQELEEVLNIVIPMILDDCMKSTMKEVKFFAVDLLFDLIKTS
jgi:virulence-associated protein VapD